MSPIDIILFIGFGGGLFGGFCGVVLTNIAVQQMRIVLNRDRQADNQLRWHDAIQRVAQNVIDSYRASYPQGPLYRKLVIGYYIAGIGFAVGIASAFALKFVG